MKTKNKKTKKNNSWVIGFTLTLHCTHTSVIWQNFPTLLICPNRLVPCTPKIKLWEQKKTSMQKKNCCTGPKSPSCEPFVASTNLVSMFIMNAMNYQILHKVTHFKNTNPTMAVLTW